MSFNKPSDRLFEAARHGGKPSAADRTRVREKLEKRLTAAGTAVAVGAIATKTAAGTATAAAGGGSAGLSTTAVGGTAATTVGVGSGLGAAGGGGLALGAIAKVLLPVVVLGATATAASMRTSGPSAPADPPAIAAPASPRKTPPPARERGEQPALEPALAAPLPAPAPEPAPELAPSPLPSPSAASVPAHRAQAAAPPRPSSPSADATQTAAPPTEIALLEAMNAALARRDASTTLGLASEHARLYPNGTLAEEREGARALALCLVGSASAARDFVRAHPSSPLVGRLHAVCQDGDDSLKEPHTTGQ